MTLFFPLLFAAFSEDDQRLIQRLKRREPQAMGELYDRYARWVYSLIFRIVNNEGVAEDLVQESFLRVWNRIQAFDEERGALATWLLAVARNQAIDYMRSTHGRIARSAIEISAHEHPALFVDMERDILDKDRIRLLKNAFERLTPSQRTVIELAYFEGLSQSEMAERLHEPLGTVKTWVRSALSILRTEVGVTA